jgi:hypothetical protein
VEDLIIGRDDGTLQILGFDMGPAAVQFSARLGESVRSVACGSASSAGFDEVVASTYSGRVVSFTSEPLSSRNLPPASGCSGTADSSLTDTDGVGVGAAPGGPVRDGRVRAIRLDESARIIFLIALLFVHWITHSTPLRPACLHMQQRYAN